MNEPKAFNPTSIRLTARTKQQMTEAMELYQLTSVNDFISCAIVCYAEYLKERKS